MKKYLFFILAMTVSVTAFSQNFKENRKKADRIKADDAYYFGESGECKNSRKADEEALNELLENIAMDKSLHPLYFQNSDDEDEQHERILGTFSEVLKKQSDDLVLDDANGSAKAFRYIKKSVFAELCKVRESKIKDYIAEAMNAEDLYKIGDALRYYYWALILCHSHPDGNSLKFREERGPEVNCYRWLLRRTENILADVTVIPLKQEKGDNNEFIFKFSYLGNGIDGLNFSYNNGNGTAQGTVDNGLSTVKLVHSDMHNVNIVIDLENTEAVKFYDPEVYSIINALDEQIDFPGSKKLVPIDKAKKVNNVNEEKTYADKNIAQSMEKSEEFINAVASSEPQNDYLKTMEKIEKAIAKKDLNSMEKYFTPDGMQMMRDLFSYGNGKIIGKPSYKLLDFNDEVLCRSITMQFDFKGNVSFIRDIVFRFDKNTKKVKSIAFRLTDITESQIFAKEKWSDEARLTLINFIEDYQTAYALKRKDYLNQIYSESALIIVGSVLKETKKTDDIRLDEKVRIKYDTLSKGQYMKRLERVFDNNEFISIRFTNTSFNTVNNINNVIGVQLKQEYFSSNYGDVGYLFLMVDLRHEKPIIHVRTWQPNETPVDDIINDKSFVFM
jgi:hypothetical protein